MTRSCALVVCVAAFWAHQLLAQPTQSTTRPEDFDRRAPTRATGEHWTSDQKLAAEKLKARLPQVVVEMHPIIGSPKWLRAKSGFLTGPNGKGRAVAPETVEAFPGEDRDRSIKAVLQQHQGLFGHGPEVLAKARRTRDYATGHSGLRTVVWEQDLAGIPLYEAVLLANVTAQGEVVTLSSQFLPAPEAAAERGMGEQALPPHPLIAARQALVAAIKSVGEQVPESALAPVGEPPSSAEQKQSFRAGALPGEARTRLVWLPLDRQRLRLCWSVELTRRERNERFRLVIDATTGEILVRRRLTLDLSDATFRVFTSDSPSPFSPALSAPGQTQPPVTERRLLTLSALNTNASPLGWIRDGENETRGNNVDAHLDRDGNDRPDLPRPRGTPFRVFDFPLDLSQSPTNSGAAAVVQLFYWCNWMHDRLYELGFTEAAGNFQKDNFGRGGLGGDALEADAQDGSGFNNSNFTPSPDGEPPRLQAFLFNGPNPWRDAAYDAELVLHEYTHGLSERLVGGGVGLSNPGQTAGLAEGWSDFYAMALLSEPDDDLDGVYAYGGYIMHLFAGLRENYYFGVRRYPYSTDLSKNPLTFRHLYQQEITGNPDVPRNPVIPVSGPEPHDMGEIWCSALREVRANLIRKHGFERGNETILKLVTDGMKLSPPNPNFLEARDAILLADEVDNQRANTMEIWDGFAKRGMGLSASTIDIPLVAQSASEAFNVPEPLQVQTPDEFVAIGSTGGPFAPESQTWLVSNLRPSALIWTVGVTPEWVEVSPTTGVLRGESSSPVNVSLTPAARLLPPGGYSTAVYFTNLVSSKVSTQKVVLNIGQRDWLTQNFEADTFDLNFSTLIFTPDGSSNYYNVCHSRALEFPTDPSGGTDAQLVDDSYRLISLADGAEVSIFGVRSNQFFLGSNGDILFTLPPYYTNSPSPGLYAQAFHSGLTTFFERLRVGALYADLNPSAGGTISWKQLPDRVVFTYENVLEFGTAQRNNLQVELFYNGVIRFTYLDVAATRSIVGLSSGGGATRFVAGNLSGRAACYPALQLTAPAMLQEGDSTQNGIVSLEHTVTQDVMVRLQSSNTNLLSVSRVILPAGQSSVSFPIRVADDSLLNGSRLVLINALAEGYEFGSAQIEIADNEVASISLDLPARVQEGAGHLADQGVVRLSAVPAGPINVQLTSSDPQLVSVPRTVTIPAGEMEVGFDFDIGDNELFDASRTITVVASVQNWQAGAASIEVADNESRLLSLSLPSRVSESAGTLTNAAQIVMGGLLRSDLAVRLSSDTPSVLQVPGTVLVPAGQRSAAFNLVLTDNRQPSGPVTVNVRATAGGFIGTNASIVVADNEGPTGLSLPSPLNFATRVPVAIALGWSLEQDPAHGIATFEVYFGTNAVFGREQFLGRTEETNWPVSGLELGTTYFWQVVANKGNSRWPGPVWQFTTAKLSHFEISHSPSAQIGVPFEVKVVARDENQQTANTFEGNVRMSALTPGATDSTIVIAEVDTASPRQIELANVSGRDLEISGWEVALYDWASWPAPRAFYKIPSRTLCLAGEVFVLRAAAASLLPSSYPLFLIGTNLAWNNTATGNPIAVLLRDATGKVIDFMCAADAQPSAIAQPVAISTNQWLGTGVPAKFASNSSYQRKGNSDHNDNSDWVVGVTNIGRRGIDLRVPFTGQQGLPLTLDPALRLSQGVWTGHVTLAQVAPVVNLQADDGEGHTGMGPVFSVMASNDLVITLNTAPSIARIGSAFKYLIVVSNSGPAAATLVVLTNKLPAQANLISAVSTQGGCRTSNGQVICDLGTLPAKSSVTTTIQVEPTKLGFLTNQVFVGRRESETFLANNQAVAVTPVDYPWLITSGALVVREGDLYDEDAIFPVRLSDPCLRPVTVNFFTSDGTASAGSDYVATNGTLIFQPGQTSTNIVVTTHGDWLVESNETFFLNFDQPVNAVLATNRIRCTLLDNDFFGDVGVSIFDTSVIEGDEGTNYAVFTLTLTGPASRPLAVFYSTQDGSASAGLDYVPTFGRVDFPFGVTNRTITVPVLGDRLFETNENFFVNLDFSLNPYLQRDSAKCVIIDDDARQLHHLRWTSFGPTQLVNVPFVAGITAEDEEGRPVTTFGGRTSIRAGRDVQELATGVGDANWEYPLSSSYLSARLQTIYSPNEVGRGGRICALALNVSLLPGQTLSNWTIRLKEAVAPCCQNSGWEGAGWTEVYRADQSWASPGWIKFLFQAPFIYSGSAPLMVDFSFKGANFSSDGICRATRTESPRSLVFRSDGGFGDPLIWSGLNPPPEPVKMVPDISFSIDTPVPVLPLISGDFVDGFWMGDIRALDAGSDVVLVAQDNLGHIGLSSTFNVLFPTNGVVKELNPPAPERLRIAVVGQVGTSLRLSFETVLGEKYQMESAASLSQPLWNPFELPVSGTGRPYDFTASPQGRRQCFFRIRVIP